MKKAAIIIVTYNAEKYVKPLFLSLRKLDYPKDKFKVFVVDNGSTDRTVEELELVISNWSLVIRDDGGGDEEIKKSDVEIIESEKNLGFAGGNNLGMRKAIKQGFSYVVLLNQDMVVDKDWLKELVRVAESPSTPSTSSFRQSSGSATGRGSSGSPLRSDDIGIVQAMMLLYKNRDTIYSTGDRLNYLGIGYSGNFQFSIFNFQLRKNIITYAGGASVLYKRGVLEKVGLFDESFFMYHEDSDLSWRARMAGYEIVLARDAVCYHDYQFKRNKRVLYWTEKNRLAFLFKNFSLRTLILIAPMYVIMDIGMLGYALATGWFWEKIKAYGWFLANLGQILEKRQVIQKNRKVSDRELKRYLVAGIEFEGFENPLLRYVANPMLRLYWVMVRWLI